MGGLLERMAGFFARVLRDLEAPGDRTGDASWAAAAAAGAPPSGAVSAPSPRPEGGGDGPGRDPERAPFLLSVDDAGQYLVVLEQRLVLGHARSPEADLAFLADVGPRHAILERRDSFSSGPVWWIEPHGKERVLRNGVALEGTTELHPDDEVRLGANLTLVHRVPDPASHTVLLEIRGGEDSSGARHVLLFGDGEGGRIRIGAALGRHVRIAGFQHEVTLVRSGHTLYVSSPEGVRGARSRGRGVELPIPPVRRVDLRIGSVQGSRPPFGISLGPADSGRAFVR